MNQVVLKNTTFSNECIQVKQLVRCGSFLIILLIFIIYKSYSTAVCFYLKNVNLLHFNLILTIVRWLGNLVAI